MADTPPSPAPSVAPRPALGAGPQHLEGTQSGASASTPAASNSRAAPAAPPANTAGLDISHRRIWRIAGPAIAANIATPLVGLVDTAIIGALPGAEHLAAVGIGATIFSMLFWSFGFLRMGTTGQAAQALGRGDTDAFLLLIVRSGLTAFGLGVLLLVLQTPLLWAGMQLLGPSSTVEAMAESYVHIRIWSAPFTLMTYVATGFLIGLGRTEHALMLQLVMNAVNLGCNLLFVAVFNYGVAGIAYGTLIAEVTSAVLGWGMVVAYFGGPALAHALGRAATWQLEGFLAVAKVNGYLFVRTMLLIGAFSFLTRQAAQMSDAALAAAQILLTFTLLISLGLDGLAYAGEALVGRALGEGRKTLLIQAHRRCAAWAVVTACAYAAAFAAFGSEINALLTDNTPILTRLADMQLLIALTPLVGWMSYHYDGVYIGLTATRAMMLTMLLAVACFVPAALYLPELASNQMPNLGLTPLGGLWLALLCFLAVRGLSQAAWLPRLLQQLEANGSFNARTDTAR